MKNFLNKLESIITTKRVSLTLILLNIISIILGISFLIIRSYNILWDIFGIVLLITWFGNLLEIYRNSQNINRETKLGHRISLLGYFYLLFSIYAMYIIIRANSQISATYSNKLSDLARWYGWISIAIFGLLIQGLILSTLNFKNFNINESNTQIFIKRSKRNLLFKRILKKIMIIFCYICLVVGIFFSIVMILGAVIGLQPPEYYNDDMRLVIAISWSIGTIGMFVAVYGLAYAFVFLSTTILILKIKDKTKNPKKVNSIKIIGIILTIIFMLPLCFTPYYIYSAEQNFTNAFGEDWRNKIPKNIEEKYFLRTPFSIPYYFFGSQPKDCKIERDITFYKDDDFRLKFDVYMPKENKKDLPGENSVLVWLHGGGWVAGDKGGYRIEYNKYFAAQGYIIFDVQYGLYDSGQRTNPRFFLDTPNHVKGKFNITEMVKHIGIFMEYLFENYKKYDVNIENIFFGGGSAGGQLACASALAIQSGDYEDIFPSNITGNVKGFVPYYPGNRLAELSNIDGKKKFIDPARLVKSNSPPCLIFHGTSDGSANPSISQDFKDAYTEKNNQKCAILWAPLGGHGADIYFNGYYNMVFLYYMERFLYLCVNDYI